MSDVLRISQRQNKEVVPRQEVERDESEEIWTIDSVESILPFLVSARQDEEDS